MYKSRLLKNKKSILKLYFFYILDLVGIGSFLHKKFGFFKVQMLIAEDIDNKVSLENIFRIITFNKKIKTC